MGKKIRGIKKRLEQFKQVNNLYFKSTHRSVMMEDTPVGATTLWFWAFKSVLVSRHGFYIREPRAEDSRGVVWPGLGLLLRGGACDVCVPDKHGAGSRLSDAILCLLSAGYYMGMCVAAPEKNLVNIYQVGWLEPARGHALCCVLKETHLCWCRSWRPGGAFGEWAVLWVYTGLYKTLSKNKMHQLSKNPRHRALESVINFYPFRFNLMLTTVFKQSRRMDR